MYSYTLNNPIKYTDPSGQIPDPTDAIALGCGPAAGACFVIKEAVEGAVIFAVYSIYQGIKEKVKEYKNIEDVPEGMPVINEASVNNESQKAGIGKRFQEMKEIAGTSGGTGDPGQNPNDDKDPFKEAKSGGKHGGTYRNYINRSVKDIQNAIKGYEKVIQEHFNKIANPSKYAENWNKMGQKAKNDLLKHWQNDIQRNTELRDVMKGILQEKLIF